MIRDYVQIIKTWVKRQLDRIEEILTILWKHVLKQAFGQDEELQEEVVPLSNTFSNKLDELVNTSDKEYIISRYWNRNTPSLWMPGKGRNIVTGHFEIEEGALERNRVAGYFKMEEGATRKNRIAGYSERGEGIKGINKDMVEISFFDQGITKCNWQKDAIFNLWVDKEKHLLAGKTPRHTNSSNLNSTWIPSPQ